MLPNAGANKWVVVSVGVPLNPTKHGVPPRHQGTNKKTVTQQKSAGLQLVFPPAPVAMRPVALVPHIFPAPVPAARAVRARARAGVGVGVRQRTTLWAPGTGEVKGARRKEPRSGGRAVYVLTGLSVLRSPAQSDYFSVNGNPRLNQTKSYGAGWLGATKLSSVNGRPLYTTICSNAAWVGGHCGSPSEEGWSRGWLLGKLGPDPKQFLAC